MSMHADPKTAAEKFARHLELNYGLQLDPFRHAALVSELEALAAEPEPAEASKGKAKKGKG